MRWLPLSWPGPHQIVPSRAYFDLGGAPPLSLMPGPGWIGGYPQFVSAVDRRFGQSGNLPGSTSRNFHDYVTARGGQDDWRSDKTGVRYFHIYGQRSISDTIQQVSITARATPNGPNAWTVITTTELGLGLGDGTVPLLSVSGSAPAETSTRRALDSASLPDPPTTSSSTLESPAIRMSRARCWRISRSSTSRSPPAQPGHCRLHQPTSLRRRPWTGSLRWPCPRHIM